MLLFMLVFSDMQTIFHLSFLPTVEKAEAATGDFAIFRENTGIDTVLSSSVLDVSWDTTVQSNSNIALQGNSSDIDLADGGKYLVIYNAWTEQGTSTAGSNRRSHQSWLTLAGTPLEYGRGGSYLRDGSGATFAYNSGSAIIDATAGDDLQVHIQRDDANTTAGMNVRPATNGVNVLKLKDGWDYLRVHKSATSSNINGFTTFTDVTWDTADEVDTGSFGFTPTSGIITLKGDDNDHFLVTTNVRLEKTSTNQRENYEMILTLDGVEIPGSRVTAYIRGNNNGNNDFNDALVYTGIIQKDSIGDQTLNVEVRRESTSSGGSTFIMGDQTALSIVALPDEGSYVMLGRDSDTAAASARTGFGWTTQDEVDSYAFAHSTTTNPSRIEIDTAGDYLFFSTLYATTSNTNDRQTFRADWRKNGSTLLNYGSFGQYARDNTANSAGASGGAIMDGLAASDYIEVTQFDESGAPVNETFNANRAAIQGILLDENFFGTDVVVSATSSHVVEADIPTTDVYAGGGFVIQEQTSSRNITSIIVTENGTVDGSTGLDNIELYYDLDTTSPYDCSSESYGGGEAQFGSTDTNGFSGANGVSSFSGSVSISTTQAMCVYAVYDVTASSSDGQTVELSIDDPSTDVAGSGSPSIGPVTAIGPTGSTTLRNAELTQIHYHWRHDDGSETTATSITGTQDTSAIGFANGTTRRLRMEVSAEGSTDSAGLVSLLDDFSTGNTKTISEGSERLLLVGIHYEDSASGPNVNSVSYGGQTLTEVREETIATVAAASNGVWVGYLTESQIAVATGNTITPTWTGGTPDTVVLYSSTVLENVDQGSPVSDWSANNGTSTSSIQPTTTVSVVSGDRTVYFVVSGTNGLTHSEPAGYAEGTEQDSGGAMAANAHISHVRDGTEQPTATFSGTANRLAVVALNVNVSSNVESPQQYRLEYAQKITTCSAVVSWTDVGTGGGGDWDVVNTSNLTDGNDTTNITLAANGAVTDENTTFFTPNGAQKDTSSQTGNTILSSTEFIELEYAIEPTVSATEGNTYCFRVSDNGTSLRNYDVYAEGTISADFEVSASGTATTTLSVGSTGEYVGGQFIVTRPSGSNENLTDITITETGTIDAQNDLDNIEIWFDEDQSIPYDCSSESYDGDETQFGSTDTDGFSSANGTSTFSGSVSVRPNRTFCGYVVLDVGSGASNGETINIEIANPSVDVVLAGFSVGPSTAVSPAGSTTIAGSILTQTHYHWRNDDGDETDTGATSASGGLEDTTIVDIPRESTRRLRMQVSNEGTVSSQATTYRLEYGTKITTCSAVASWSQVGVGVAFATSASPFIADGNTTDVDTPGNGAMTEENTTLDGVGALREDSSESGSITLSGTQYTELEFSIEATTESGYETDYCFRVTDSGTPLVAYDTYAELTTREKLDFFIQHGSETVSGTSLTLTAGVDYVAPSATTSAFVRITGAPLTGAGDNTGLNGQQADDVTAYISDQSDIMSSFTISRPPSATSNTHVDWEIVEFIGIPGTDNEIIVRRVGEISFAATEFTHSGATTSNVSDGNDVVVFITGQQNRNAGTVEYNDGLFTADWNATNTQPDFERGDADVTADVSYAVVEFTGANWKIQRVPHTYSAAGVAETETITAVTAISQTFLHSQKRVGEGLNSIDEGGHLVHISSIGAVSFELRNTAETPSDHVSVTWVIENTQTGTGKMEVYQSSGELNNADPEPATYSVSIGSTVNTINASIFGVNTTSGTGTTYPRLQTGFAIASSTHYEIYRSDTNNDMEYKVEVIEWPVAETSVRQNYYRFYVDNDLLDPTDPWPVGATDLGENTSIIGADDPLGEGDRVRIRMSLLINNASLPAEVQSFKLQYGNRVTSCSAIAAWSDLGNPASGAVWRGYDGAVADGTEIATSTPAPGTLNISVSDVAGTYEEQNNSSVNPYVIDLGEDVEYDWLVEHNGATQLSDYCFRMIRSDDTELDGYNNYPTLRTTGYTPVIGAWQWFDDADSATPVTLLAAENVTPTDLANENEIKLRATAAEVEGAPGVNVKFKLQYSEYADFSLSVFDVTATSTCVASSTWCYVDGAGVDNAVIDTTVLTDPDTCVAGVGDGCGSHNEIPDSVSTIAQPSFSKTEFEFTLKPVAPRVNAVYYFRLYDVTNDTAVSASSSYPSIQIEGSSLVFSLSGLPVSTFTESIETDVTSTASGVAFGSLPFDTEYEAAHRLSINTNATEGYQMLMYVDQNLVNSYGASIPVVTGTNAAPLGWSSGCSASATGCVGYHAGDDLLQAGSARFGPDDSYAAFSTTPQEVMYSSVPANESHDIVYKIKVGQEQPAGDYQETITFIAVPVF